MLLGPLLNTVQCGMFLSTKLGSLDRNNKPTVPWNQGTGANTKVLNGIRSRSCSRLTPDKTTGSWGSRRQDETST